LAWTMIDGLTALSIIRELGARCACWLNDFDSILCCFVSNGGVYSRESSVGIGSRWFTIGPSSLGNRNVDGFTRPKILRLYESGKESRDDSSLIVGVLKLSPSAEISELIVFNAIQTRILSSSYFRSRSQ
jgi:hypothetical protein